MKDNSIAILGAICGDIIGSSYEFRPTKRLDFKLLPVYARLPCLALLTPDIIKTINRFAEEVGLK